MSRRAVFRTLTAYFAIAAAFSVVWELATPGVTGLRLVFVISQVVGRALGLFLVPGVLPLVFWAFGRFRAEKAGGPLVAWLFIGLLFAFLAADGASYDGD